MSRKRPPKREADDAIAELNTQAAALLNRGQFREAHSYAREAAHFAKAHLSPDDPLRAAALHILGAVTRQLGDPRAAIALQREALEVFMRDRTEWIEQIVGVINEIAGAHMAMDNPGEAKRAYAEGETIARSAGEAGERLLGLMLYNQAVLEWKTGGRAAAIALVGESHTIRRRVHGPRDPETALTELTLARYRFDQDPRGSIELAEHAYDTFFQRQPAHPNTADAATSLASMYERIGDTDNASGYYELAATIEERMYGPSSGRVALTLLDRANLLVNAARFGEAVDIIKDVRARLDALMAADDPDADTTLGAVVNLYGKLHQHGEVSKLVPLAAKRLRRPGIDDRAATRLYQSLATQATTVGQYEEAILMRKEALTRIERARGARSEEYGNELMALAEVHRVRDDFDHALPLFERAYQTLRDARGEQDASTATALHNLATCYHEAGMHDKAGQMLERSLALTKSVFGDRHPNVAPATRALADALISAGRSTDALPLMDESMRLDYQRLAAMSAVASDNQRLSFLHVFRGRLDALITLATRDWKDSEAGRLMAANAILRTKGLATEALVAQHLERVQRAHPRLAAQVTDLLRLKRELTELLLREVADDEAPQSRTNLQSSIDVVESELASNLPELRLERALACDVATIASALPSGAALIEYIEYNEVGFHLARGNAGRWLAARYAALRIPGGNPAGVRIIDLGPAAEIDACIERLGQSLRATGTTGEAGHALRRLVVDPVFAADGPRPSQIFIAPDADLSLVPFEILPTGDGDETNHLLDEVEVSYLGTARDILRFVDADVPRGEPANASMVIGDPAFRVESGSTGNPSAKTSSAAHPDLRVLQFPPLPASRDEARIVGSRLGVTPMLGAAVTKRSLLEARSPRVLHFSTHGYCLRRPPTRKEARLTMIERMASNEHQAGRLEDPMVLSGLALAGVTSWLGGQALPPDFGNGLLTAEELSQLDLAGSALVVLSGCETGMGHGVASEGVFGLRRAATLAGARATIVSLWKVADDATADFMLSFYDKLSSGATAAAALRHAAKAMKDVYPDEPYYWGAFILQGDPKVTVG